MDGRVPVRVGLLLPLTASSAEVQTLARSLQDAAQLAVFETGNPNVLLLPQDTGGNAAGAASAAQQLVDEGAEIIIGPLFADSVRAAAPIANAAGVNLIAFSTDTAVAQPGAYLMSFTAEQEVERVVGFAVDQGLLRFAALVPRGPYGNRASQAFSTTVNRSGGEVTDIVPYDAASGDFIEPAKILAESYTGSGPAAAVAPDPTLPYAPAFGGPFQAVLIPEGGSTVRSIAPLLPYYDIDNRTVRFMGTGLWDDTAIWKEPSLNGGWFAAPAPEVRAGFVRRFRQAYGYDPERIATLAFDAVSLASSFADALPGERFTTERLTDPSGFLGVDGAFRFRPDGTADRGLAVLEIDRGKVTVVSPAPLRFDPIPAPGSEPGYGEPGYSEAGYGEAGFLEPIEPAPEDPAF
jgi:ABC-type branched-subunit amino acid transport system substrate-binding protein